LRLEREHIRKLLWTRLKIVKSSGVILVLQWCSFINANGEHSLDSLADNAGLARCCTTLTRIRRIEPHTSSQHDEGNVIDVRHYLRIGGYFLQSVAETTRM
jgi:hypothetical protein